MRRFVVLVGAGLLGGCFPDGSSDDDEVTIDPGAPGTLESVWRRSSTTYQGMSAETGAMLGTRTIEGPATIPSPDGGADLEVVLQVDGSTLSTFVWQQGQPVHHRLRQPIVTIDEGSFVLQDGATTRSFTFADGHLSETGTMVLADQLLLTTATYGAVAYPPAGWPADVLETELPEVTP